MTEDGLADKLEALRRIFEFCERRYSSAVISLKHTQEAISSDRKVLRSLMHSDGKGPFKLQILGPDNQALEMKDSDLLSLVDNCLEGQIKSLEADFVSKFDSELFESKGPSRYILNKLKEIFSGEPKTDRKIISKILNFILSKKQNFREKILVNLNFRKMLDILNLPEKDFPGAVHDFVLGELQRFNKCLDQTCSALQGLLQKISTTFYSKLFKNFKGDRENKPAILHHLTQVSFKIPLSFWAKGKIADPTYEDYFSRPTMYRYELVKQQVNLNLENRARAAHIALLKESLLNLNYHLNDKRFEDDAKEEPYYAKGTYISLTQTKAFQEASRVNSLKSTKKDSKDERVSGNQILSKEDYFDQRAGFPSFMDYLKQRHLGERSVEAFLSLVKLEVDFRLSQRFSSLDRSFQERFGKLINLEKSINKFGYQIDSNPDASIIAEGGEESAQKKGLFLLDLDSNGLNVLKNDFFRMYKNPSLSNFTSNHELEISNLLSFDQLSPSNQLIEAKRRKDRGFQSQYHQEESTPFDSDSDENSAVNHQGQTSKGKHNFR